jgi:hypothetical protein
VITIQQEIVTLKYRGSYLGFYWPFGFDLVMVGSVIPNPVAPGHIFVEPIKQVLLSVEEAHQLFDTLMDAGAY